MPIPTIIIIPGAWHTPAHYTKLITALTAQIQNVTAFAISLPSLNSRPPLPLPKSWKEDADAVRAAIIGELDAGRDVIALAHSYGGVVMGEAVKGLGKGKRVEDELGTRSGGVVGLVYMCAMALPRGQTYVGQMVPVGAEEEEIERERNEYAAKKGGVRMTEV